MQDLTTGSLTRHLLKTTSFMLVTMVFQTLYFLVDLYWVGRLGKEAVAGVGIAGNLKFIVLAVTQMLERRHHHAGVARGGTEGSRPRAARLQSVAGAVGGRRACCSSIVGDAHSPCVRERARRGRANGRALAVDYLLWFIPAMSLQFAMVAMGAALRGTGNFRPGMIVSTASVILNMFSRRS